MAKRPLKNDIPAKTPKKSTVFQGDGKVRQPSSYVTAKNHKNGTPHTGLTTNRSR